MLFEQRTNIMIRFSARGAELTLSVGSGLLNRTALAKRVVERPVKLYWHCYHGPTEMLWHCFGILTRINQKGAVFSNSSSPSLGVMTDKDKPRPAEEKRVTCAECMKEVPLSAAKSDEASDYVFYFCGADCYTKWRSQRGMNPLM